MGGIFTALFTEGDYIRVIGHRGASHLLPDNTFLSFDQAIAEKADMIELDVRKTADGKLVLYHDWYIQLYCNAYQEIGVSRLISHTTYEQLNNCCLENGYQITMLKDVLERYGNRIDINIEVKAGGYEQEVIDLVYKYDLQESVVLSSFAPWIVKKIKTIDSSLRTGWIVGQERILKVNRLGRMLLSFIFEMLGADSAHLHYEMIIPDIINRFHARNIPVYVWTVNDIELMKHLINLGVDGIITNKPGVLYAVVNNEAIVDETALVLNAKPVGVC